MKLLADESVDFPIIRQLREVGYEVDSIAESHEGIPDEEVLDLANVDDALLLTADKDFGELVFRQGKVHNGVVLLRLEGLTTHDKAALVCEVFETHASELPGSFAVISRTMVRIRHGF